jgi:hypothetical protein
VLGGFFVVGEMGNDSVVINACLFCFLKFVVRHVGNDTRVMKLSDRSKRHNKQVMFYSRISNKQNIH